MINCLHKIIFAALTLGCAKLVAAEYDPVLDKAMTQILSNRYSGTQFDVSIPVMPEQLQDILEAARLAPSSRNEQPWNFIICDRNDNPDAFEKALTALDESNQKWAKKAAILMICVAAEVSSHNGKPNRWGHYDTGAAAFSMMLKATSLGLMAHQMGGFDEYKIRREFLIPEGYIPMSVMAIGYQSHEETQPQRKRKPLGENFFMGVWGNPFCEILQLD